MGGCNELDNMKWTWLFVFCNSVNWMLFWVVGFTLLSLEYG